MKHKNKYLLGLLIAICALSMQTTAFSQDDLYYDPATDAQTQNTAVTSNYDNEPGNVTRRYDNDDYYQDEDDYAYEYSSRIRRFHQPARVVDYYDPFYVDLYNYDPYFLPGATIYTYGYNDYWTWRRWQRWNRWNSWNSYDYGWGCNAYGWNSWGWNRPGYYSPWNNYNVYNNYYYDPYWTYNGYNPYYNNYGWSNNNYYYDNNSNGGNNGYQPKTYTGARRNGTSVNQGYARINSASGNGRLIPATTSSTQVIDLKSRPNGRILDSQKAVDAVNNPSGAKGTRDVVPPSTGRTPEAATPRRVDKPETTTPPRTRSEERPRTDEPRRPSTEPRNIETRPKEEARPTRRSAEPDNDRSSRPAKTEESRPVRRTNEQSSERSSRSNESEARPSRSENNRSIDSGRSSSGNSGNSGNSGSSKSSSGSGSGSKSSSGGGSRGRN